MKDVCDFSLEVMRELSSIMESISALQSDILTDNSFRRSMNYPSIPSYSDCFRYCSKAHDYLRKSYELMWNNFGPFEDTVKM